MKFIPCVSETHGMDTMKMADHRMEAHRMMIEDSRNGRIGGRNSQGWQLIMMMGQDGTKMNQIGADDCDAKHEAKEHDPADHCPKTEGQGGGDGTQ